jgi:hypothetical protein
VQQGLGLLLENVRGERAAEEDVLPPEGQEEEQVGAVDGAGDVAAGVCGGDARDDGGHRGAVGGEVGKLLAAGKLHLRDRPFQGAGGAMGHDEDDAHPEVVDVGAAELPRAGEVEAHVVPLSLESAEVGVPRARLGKAGGGGRGGGGGAPGAGEGESPFAGIEVLALGKGQDSVVAEDGGGRVVQHGVEVGAAEGVVELSALLLAHVRSEVEGPVDLSRQDLGELGVAE